MAEAPAVLYSGVIDHQRPPEWAGTVVGLTGVQPSVANRTAAAALLLLVDGEVFALTYGLGHHLIAPGYLAPGFGLAFNLRALGPGAVRHVTHTAMDARGRTDRNSVAVDQRIDTFGIEQYGEIVTRLVGKPKDIPLTFTQGRSRTAQITGSDSLRIHLGQHPEALVADLREILRIYREEKEDTEFGFITRVRPLKSSDPRRTELDTSLDAMLGPDGPQERLALTVPTIHLDGEEATSAYVLKVARARHMLTGDLALDPVRDAVAGLEPGQRLKALKRGSIQGYADEEATEATSSAIPAHKWIAAEANLGSSRFFHHEGQWFEIGDQHTEILHDQVDAILAEPSDIALPDWEPEQKDERTYNEWAAGETEGYTCLDRKLLYTQQHPHGIEGCDLLGPNNELIHVKRAASTAPLSHLFQQGRIAIEALLFDREAREKFVARTRAVDPDRELPDDWLPTTVVFAISLPNHENVSSRSLFTFAQVSLLQTFTALRNLGIKVAVTNITTVK
ncbi:uncharacterized protein (TIGR04141 family) [Lipingzhangella halophila]|uniref:Uncharacterized protein (TIGR04141 family) n=1 Tax=Lipingzhangella halophila TaxID=1783352 RepID=A0A7W7RLW0_9ACTN|nr:uncharacterized protein (TIGR04141 family) [Lipingzhangella halophila]